MKKTQKKLITQISSTSRQGKNQLIKSMKRVFMYTEVTFFYLIFVAPLASELLWFKNLIHASISVLYSTTITYMTYVIHWNHWIFRSSWLFVTGTILWSWKQIREFKIDKMLIFFTLNYMYGCTCVTKFRMNYIARLGELGCFYWWSLIWIVSMSWMLIKWMNKNIQNRI